MANSSGYNCKLRCIYTTILPLVYTIFCITIISSSETPISYNDHCASVVPESKPTETESSTLPFPPNQEGYYLGGDGIFSHVGNSSNEFYYYSDDRKTMLFSTSNMYETNSTEVSRIEASLILQPPGENYYMEDVSFSYSMSSRVIALGSQNGPLTFHFKGFWSNSSGKICMVGSSTMNTDREGKTRVFQAVLKLEGVEGSNTITSLVTGTLESLSSVSDSSYFQPVSLLMFPRVNYKYTKVSKDFNSGCSGGGGVDVPSGESLPLPLNKPICALFSYSPASFPLEYSGRCNDTKRCNLFGESFTYLPQVMGLRVVRCSDDRRSLGFLLEFPNSGYVGYYLPFNSTETLIAEGSWDVKKNKLCAVACHIGNTTGVLSVTDCSVRLTLRFPAVWSIEDASGIAGHIWSTKAASDPGYFERIAFRSYRNGLIEIPGLKYNYTFVDKAKKDSCPKERPVVKAGKQYPDANTYDMQLQMAVKNSKGKRVGWGYSGPIFVGDRPWQGNGIGWSSTDSPVESKITHNHPQNIAYTMEFTSLNASLAEYSFQVSAEGVYDAETGLLCMAGCRYNSSRYQNPVEDSMDCEVLISIQFPPMKSTGHIVGTIKSTRETKSSSYFEPISISAVPYNSGQKSIGRMDLEIIMALVSNTLLCVFLVVQIWHVKKNKNKVFPFISLVMLAVLTLGHMIPLLLNFEALFFSKNSSRVFLQGSGGWLEVNEVIVRVVTMMAFLLQCRLLQLVWSERLSGENQKASWVAERRTVYITLPIYVIGGLIALYVNRNKYGLGESINTSRRYNRSQHSLLTGIRSYAGLILDSFLLPQIFLNIFQNSNEYALSKLFYMGTTFARLLPHAYDLYRAHNYMEDYEWTYIYASPDADYYSTVWDVAISIAGLLFAGIIYMQQRFGGRCILPKRFKEKAAYEKLPVADEA